MASRPPAGPAPEPAGTGRCPSDVGASLVLELPERAAPRGAALDGPPRVEMGAAADPDHDLVARWLAGDESAFESLVHRHEGRVYRFLVRMLGNSAEAEDVAQETFLSLHRHGRSFRGEARFSTFVYRVAANGALNRRRSLGRYGERVRRLAQWQAGGEGLPSAPRDPHAALEGAERERLVQTALLELAPRLRLPLVLYDIEGLAYAEIARALDVAEGTVKSRIHRARQLLRRRLAPLLQLARESR